MPGIHVHTLSQLNWFDQEKKSLLTVPGSYWLCHKKNIYKFIFKYHRATKNTTQFSYGKELLKIIRRVIKCHPSQGQQFGTQHLLVTYNCTSWTRQDKMFAILKFQQRTNAAAFSHAFVLTIKICSSSEEKSLFDLKYPIRKIDADAAFKDSNNTADIDEKATKAVIHTIDKVPPKKLRMYSGRINQILKHSENALSETSEAPVNSILRNDIMEKSANFHERLDGRVKSATCTVTEEDFTDKHNTKLHDSVYVNKSTNCDSKKSEKDTEQNPVVHTQNQLRTTKRKDEIQEVEKAIGANKEAKHAEIQRQNQEPPEIRKHQTFSSTKFSSTETIKDDYNVDEQLLLDQTNSDEDSVRQKHIADDKTNSADNDNIGEDTVDSSKLPNRYFIKKDLDNVRQGRTSARSAMSPPVVDKSVKEKSQQGTSEANNANENFVSKIENEKINEEFMRKEERNEIADKSSDKRLAPISTRVVDDRAQSSTYSKSYRARKQRNREFSEKKTVTDDKILRSSNITDLVMEGLMFTIRQDQDSVAVIEQKTKLEVDEVLENSEKVETEAGEKCLLNSSLLRLENLITMIDPPRDKDDQHKTNYSVISNSAYSSPHNVSNTACHLDDISYVDRTMNKLSIPNYERHNLMDQLSPRKFGWQQRVYSTIANNDNDNYPTNRNAMEKMDQSMDWEIDNHEQDEEYMHQNNYTNIEIINEEGKEEVEDEEEDIIPEILHPTIFSPEKPNTGPLSTELLMDDTDVEETNKLDTSMKDYNDSPPASCYSSNSNKVPKSETLMISEKSTWAKRQTNIPRVISNKAITVEQMPLALQKILRYTRRFSPARNVSETAVHDDKGKMQSTMSTKNTVSETNAPSGQSNPHEFRCQQQETHFDIANTDNYSADRNSLEKSEQLMEWEDDDHEQDKKCTKNVSPKKNRDIDLNTTNESIIEITDNVEKIKDKNKDESRVIINLEDVESSNGDARHTEKKNNETHRTSQMTSSTEARTRHGSPRKLQDITEDFYHDLHVHNKNNATQQRCLRQRRRSLNSSEDVKNDRMRIEMLKFIQDMTEGVKVVVRRLDLDNMPNSS